MQEGCTVISENTMVNSFLGFVGPSAFVSCVSEKKCYFPKVVEEAIKCLSSFLWTSAHLLEFMTNVASDWFSHWQFKKELM